MVPVCFCLQARPLLPSQKLTQKSLGSSISEVLQRISHQFDIKFIKRFRMPFLEVSQISMRLIHCSLCSLHGLTRFGGLLSCTCGFRVGYRAGSKHTRLKLVNVLLPARGSTLVNDFHDLLWANVCLLGDFIFTLFGRVSRCRGQILFVGTAANVRFDFLHFCLLIFWIYYSDKSVVSFISIVRSMNFIMRLWTYYLYYIG